MQSAGDDNQRLGVEDLRVRLRVIPFRKLVPTSIGDDVVVLRHYSYPDSNLTVFRLIVADDIAWDVEDALAAIFPTLQPMTLNGGSVSGFFCIEGNDRVLFALLETLCTD